MYYERRSAQDTVAQQIAGGATLYVGLQVRSATWTNRAINAGLADLTILACN